MFVYSSLGWLHAWLSGPAFTLMEIGSFLVFPWKWRNWIRVGLFYL